jgi:hypothetical protein
LQPIKITDFSSTYFYAVASVVIVNKRFDKKMKESKKEWIKNKTCKTKIKIKNKFKNQLQTINHKQQTLNHKQKYNASVYLSTTLSTSKKLCATRC